MRPGEIYLTVKHRHGAGLHGPFADHAAAAKELAEIIACWGDDFQGATLGRYERVRTGRWPRRRWEWRVR